MTKSNFGVTVNWPVGDAEWKPTTEEVRKTAGINSYRLFVDGDQYKLEFSCTEDYHYYFHDAEGDSYAVNCFLTGNHYVHYNSEKPTVLYISGA